MQTNPLPHNSWYGYLPELPDEIKLIDFDEVWNLHPTEYGRIVMYGKEINTPRWQESYGRSYRFSGLTHQAHPIEHPYLIKLMDWVKAQTGLDYNQLLIN